MGRTKVNRSDVINGAGMEPNPVVWSASIAMREDGTLEVNVKGETGHHMAKAAMDALRSIDRIRQEPALSFTRVRGSYD